MNKNTFYVTTPIYYVNDNPHIGHAYTTLLADALARYHRAAGDDVWFLTGTDEHGQKVQKAAEAHGMTPIEQCDRTVVRFQELWKRLGITNDDFIRTTEERHKTIVRKVLQDLFDRGLIYKAKYEGLYCVPCERFFTEKDLRDGCCPECGRPVETFTESSYFFRMSQYQDWLISYIKEHPDFIQPAFRANETLGFLTTKPLDDLCISRPKSRLSWGIELPFDPDYVCYVWFDALLNYVSAIGYGSDEEKFNRYWTSCMHLIGKDILTTHTVYWPTMLHAMGLPMPKTIFAHGWWLTGNAKMSKSLGNVVNPMSMADKYGVDAFRYFLLAEMTPGNDASFTEEAFVARYNSDLANDLGNMLSRVVKLTLKNFDGVLPAPGEFAEDDKALLAKAREAIDLLESNLRGMKPDRGLSAALDVIREANRYIERTAPWTLAKEGRTERLGTVLYVAADALRVVSGLLTPIMPQKMAELRRALGIAEERIETIDFASLRAPADRIAPGSRMKDVAALFPRIQLEKPEDGKDAKKAEKQQEKAAKKEAKQQTKAVKKEDEPLPEGVVSIDDFAKIQLRTATILEAERIPDRDRLLKLKIDVGGEIRPLVAGIAQYYKPEELPGRTIVIVANLKPRKLAGCESQGMLLAAKNESGLKLITVDGGSFASGVPVG